MNLLDSIQPIRDKIDQLTLGEIIRGCRDAIGIKQYKMADLLKMSWHKLKNLETNRFLDMPPDKDIRNICEIFDLPYDQVYKVVENQVDSHRHRMVLDKHPRYIARIEKGLYTPKRLPKCSFDSTKSP